jgi:hypothetical protein
MNDGEFIITRDQRDRIRANMEELRQLKSELSQVKSELRHAKLGSMTSRWRHEKMRRFSVAGWLLAILGLGLVLGLNSKIESYKNRVHLLENFDSQVDAVSLGEWMDLSPSLRSKLTASLVRRIMKSDLATVESHVDDVLTHMSREPSIHDRSLADMGDAYKTAVLQYHREQIQKSLE